MGVNRHAKPVLRLFSVLVGPFLIAPVLERAGGRPACARRVHAMSDDGSLLAAPAQGIPFRRPGCGCDRTVGQPKKGGRLVLSP